MLLISTRAENYKRPLFRGRILVEKEQIEQIEQIEQMEII